MQSQYDKWKLYHTESVLIKKTKQKQLSIPTKNQPFLAFDKFQSRKATEELHIQQRENHRQIYFELLRLLDLVSGGEPTKNVAIVITFEM